MTGRDAPRIEVTAGRPTDAELAAVVAVLTALAARPGVDDPPARAYGGWSDPAPGLGFLRRRAGAWPSSGDPAVRGWAA